MIKRLFSWFFSPLGRVGLAIVVLVLASAATYGIYLTQQAPQQPIQFPHNLHVGLGIQCLYCHPGAMRGPSAGLPTETKCWGCHQQTTRTKTSPELQKLAKYVENNQPIPWVPVAMVPDFVHFNHRPHIAAGLNCENCHGDLSKMTVAQNPQVMNMGWCLNCHRARTVNDPEKRTKLLDCGTCHY
ncbi:MAG: cytochrome c3 family protein [Anaerolineae bacterium]